MATSTASAPSPSMTRSEYVSTLPLWRRLLATLNWRPVYDIEQETERLKIRSLESEKRTKLLEKEIDQLDQENKRLAELESKLDALLLSADSSSPTPPATGSN
jgi:phosphate uptake regulator